MTGPISDRSRPLDQMRIDRWLWAARFYKTRSQAKIAVAGGKVRVNGAKAKPSREVRICDSLNITRGNDQIDIVVVALANQRGPASVAQALYSETPESVERRAAHKAQRRMERAGLRMPKTKPSKRDRRHLMRMKTETEPD
ncbi:MAG: S4 domain-containing protein [Pseudomonadota bacterium]|nr:S4 domain-containing protein [Pseudomonadota bacterium]